MNSSYPCKPNDIFGPLHMKNIQLFAHTCTMQNAMYVMTGQVASGGEANA